MCGRFTLNIYPEALAKIYDLQEIPLIEPRYNIGPSQPVACIRQRGDHNQLDLLSWGLLPGWYENITHAPINARSETVHEKPTFAHSIKYNRCIVPASGFYEWLPQGDRKQPYYIRLLNSSVMGFAGLWETRIAEDGTELNTCCIVTTDANEIVKPIHNRMPVILNPEDYNFWLNRNMHDPHQLKKLYQPYPADLMYAHPVPDLVNIIRFDSASCIVQM
ncbi:MAG TPA: SOS response-associated peptidase [Desulfuromonadales bacterium]|nr:SOS response-associated peptidase [Desulfuromonadales bacterium]